MNEAHRRPTDHADLRLVEAAQEPDDGVRWLALVLAEMMRTGLALLAKRYPEAKGTSRCPKCGWRHG